MTTKTKKVLLAIAAIGLLLAGLAAAGLHAANKVLKQQIELALGPESEVSELVVGLTAIEVRGLRIRAPKGWPTEDALRAERVVVTPDLAGLMSARMPVPGITIEGAYLSVWRTKNGKLRLLPSLMEKADPSTATISADVSIGRIALQGGVLELFDGSIRQPAHKLRLEALQATVENLQVPSIASQTKLALRGTIKGVQRDGKLALEGNIVLATRDSNLKAQLDGVDLLALQPYLIKAAETGVKRGTVDLALHSKVSNNRLHAPGTVTIANLELAPSSGAFGTFMGLPRSVVLAALKDKHNRINLKFTLEGNLNDPQFSLSESFAKRMGASVADTLGVSIEDMARGVGSAVQGLGSAVKGLLGQ